ncbi:hypothetical protein BJ165DRAFT_1405295 [Panaeolus papilionaceus]|nr:hypothetical protein BJ165DRAFT_1405295 [Panaeolus papilionaceus]
MSGSGGSLPVAMWAGGWAVLTTPGYGRFSRVHGNQWGGFECSYEGERVMRRGGMIMMHPSTYLGLGRGSIGLRSAYNREMMGGCRKRGGGWWLRGWEEWGPMDRSRAASCGACGVERGGSAGGGEELVVEMSEQVVVVREGEREEGGEEKGRVEMKGEGEEEER